MKVVDITGGRQIDLQSLVSHVRTGLTPEGSFFFFFHYRIIIEFF